MIAAVPASPSTAPASLSRVAGSCRVMPQVMTKAKIGVVDASTTVMDAGTYCCAQVIIRNGIVELMVCWNANSFQAAGVGRNPNTAQTQDHEQEAAPRSASAPR